MTKPQTPPFRSGFEKKLYAEMTEEGLNVEFEEVTVKYVQPAKDRKYLADFSFPNSPILIEAKGRLTKEGRDKLLNIKRSNPDLDLRIVFQRDNELTRRSRTKYSQWAEKQGIPWAVGRVPQEWVDEIRKTT